MFNFKSLHEGCLLLLLLLGVNLGDQTRCRLPESWTGSWFLSGHPEEILVTERTLGWLGACHRRIARDKFVFYRAADNCFQCAAFWSRHDNVLQLKSGECEEAEEGACDAARFSPDAALETMVRVGGEEVECPVQAGAMFSYNKGRAEYLPLLSSNMMPALF